MTSSVRTADGPSASTMLTRGLIGGAAVGTPGALIGLIAGSHDYGIAKGGKMAALALGSFAVAGGVMAAGAAAGSALMPGADASPAGGALGGALALGTAGALFGFLTGPVPGAFGPQTRAGVTALMGVGAALWGALGGALVTRD